MQSLYSKKSTSSKGSLERFAPIHRSNHHKVLGKRCNGWALLEDSVQHSASGTRWAVDEHNAGFLRLQNLLHPTGIVSPLDFTCAKDSQNTQHDHSLHSFFYPFLPSSSSTRSEAFCQSTCHFFGSRHPFSNYVYLYVKYRVNTSKSLLHDVNVLDDCDSLNPHPTLPHAFSPSPLSTTNFNPKNPSLLKNGDI